MTAAERLMNDRSVPHGPIRVCFTCDEEIGRGVDHVDLKKLGAQVAYTLDGEGEGILEGETFSADQAIVTITGVNTHPGYGNGKMVNAIRLAAQFVERMPWDRLAPERTSGRESFLHPYIIEGGVPQTTIKILLRSFETAELARQAELLRQIAATLQAVHPRAKIEVAIKEQYRNMAEHLAKEPRAMALAEQAIHAVGLVPRRHSIRGGTDGSRLSALGLPTPNLATGMHNFHSPLEWACLEEMETAVRVLIELAKCWGKERT
jgi:tripeptide aminopeptidase